jgi:hypothetical protein
MGVLATGSGHARPSTRPPIGMSGNFVLQGWGSQIFFGVGILIFLERREKIKIPMHFAQTKIWIFGSRKGQEESATWRWSKNFPCDPGLNPPPPHLPCLKVPPKPPCKNICTCPWIERSIFSILQYNMRRVRCDSLLPCSFFDPSAFHHWSLSLSLTLLQVPCRV